MIPSTTSLTTFETPMRVAEAETGSAVLATLRTLLAALVAIVTGVSAVAGLYIVKSALGINLLPWHSPLHDLLYHFVH